MESRNFDVYSILFGSCVTAFLLYRCTQTNLHGHPTKQVDISSNNGHGLDVKQFFGTNQKLASLPALKTGAAFSVAKEFSIEKIEASTLSQGKYNCGPPFPYPNPDFFRNMGSWYGCRWHGKDVFTIAALVENSLTHRENPNKSHYIIRCICYTGLFIKGTIPRVPPFSLYDKLRRWKQIGPWPCDPWFAVPGVPKIKHRFHRCIVDRDRLWMRLWAPNGDDTVDGRNLAALGMSNMGIPSRELTYPIPKALLKMIFLSPRWDMLIPWG